MSARTHGPGRIGIRAGTSTTFSASGLRKAAAAIEDLGYGTLWFPDRFP